MRGSRLKLYRITILSLALAMFVVGAAAAASAGGATAERLEGPFETIVPVAFADNPAGVELMFAECDFVQRITTPNGSAREVETCHLTDPFFVFPGTAPDRAFNISGDACAWFSDYFTQTTGQDVVADSVDITVTPSGQVHIRSTYPAVPIPPSDC